MAAAHVQADGANIGLLEGQTAIHADEQAQDGAVSFFLRGHAFAIAQQPACLFARQPPSETPPFLRGAFDAADGSGELRIEETFIGGS
jgi:hypothetical protein